MAEGGAANPPGDSAAAPFAMVAVFKPLSLASGQSKRGGRYQGDVQRVARGYAALVPGYEPGRRCVFPGTDPLYARIAYFYTYPRDEGDTDNIAKPLLDALCGVAYPDDGMIKRCLVDAIFFGDVADLNLSLVYAPQRPAEDLLGVLTGRHSDVLYVEVGPLTAQRLELGRQP